MKIKILIMIMAVIIINTVCNAKPIEITDKRATAEYWINRIDNGDDIILSYPEIERLNAEILQRDDYSADLANYPEKITGAMLNSRIYKITNDVELEGSDAVMANRNVSSIPDEITVRYGVTVERVNVRLLPQAPTGDKYDSIQGTALDPAEAVAVLWESTDGKFVFAQARNYFGWINKAQIAFTDRVTWLRYIYPKDFLIVTANKKFVKAGDKIVRFQMGAIIPLIDDTFKDNAWIARMPVNVKGELREVEAKVVNDGDVSDGWLPCTANNFIRQSFKFLGDVYGWGGLENSVDCSSFVGDVYRSMGIEIPRDADRQEGCMPIVSVFNDVTHKERVDIVKRAPIGALLFKPGHVMMKLGNDKDGTPIIIHAASSYFSDGYKIYVRKVLVSDLSYENAAGVATIDALTGIAFAK